MFRAMVEGPQPSLLKAIDRQDSAEANRILESMPTEVSMRDGEERVALHYAAEGMHLETVKRILESDPSLLDCTDSQGYTPLTMAVQTGRVEVVSFLLDRGASIAHLDDEGHTLVHWAVVCGQLDVLVILLERGASVNATDRVKATALHYATACDDLADQNHMAILLTLIRRGADVNAPDMDQRTPIHWCASNRNVDALLSLKQAGGDLMAVDRDRMGALHMAASHGVVEMLERIIECIPLNKIDMPDRMGATALFYAVNFGYYDAARVLLSKDSDPNHQDNRLRTPAHVAAAKGQLRMLKLIKQFGGSFEMQNYRGDLPLHEAVQSGSKDVVEWLVALIPSSVNAASHSGRTALHIAAARGDIATVIYLCGQLAHINPLMLFRDELLTPLDLAKKKGHEIVVDYLSMKQEAISAQQLPEEMLSASRNALSEHMATAKLKYGQRMRGELKEGDKAINGVKKIRRRQTTKDMSPKTPDSSSLARPSSAASRERVPRQTSTTDLPGQAEGTGENNGGKGLVEDRIEAILRQELRAVKEQAEKLGRRRRRRRASNDVGGAGSSEEAEDERKGRTKRSASHDATKKNMGNGAAKGSRDESDSHDEEEDFSELDEEESNEGDHNSKPKENGGTRKARSTANGKKSAGAGSSKSKSTVKSRSGSKGRQLAAIHDEEDFHYALDAEPVDIFEDEWEELGAEGARATGKDATRRYLHEKAIFQELTHLKRMQIQYGKVQEKVLVHSLVGNFCKMHGLNPAEYKFSSFYAWEKYLYEQLKAIYVEERERLMTSGVAAAAAVAPKYSQAQRLNKFETRLRQARAVPLNDRIRELTRIYGNGSMTAGKKPQKRDLFHGQKRCDCLGKHILVKTTS